MTPDTATASLSATRRLIVQMAMLMAIVGLMLLQLCLMDYFLDSPTQRALLYSGFGVPLLVAGMMVSAFALRRLAQVSQ